MELRTVTIFGKVMIAANEAGLKIERNGFIFDSSDRAPWSLSFTYLLSLWMTQR